MALSRKSVVHTLNELLLIVVLVIVVVVAISAVRHIRAGQQAAALHKRALHTLGNVSSPGGTPPPQPSADVESGTQAPALSTKQGTYAHLPTEDDGGVRVIPVETRPRSGEIVAPVAGARSAGRVRYQGAGGDAVVSSGDKTGELAVSRASDESATSVEPHTTAFEPEETSLAPVDKRTTAELPALDPTKYEAASPEGGPRHPGPPSIPPPFARAGYDSENHDSDHGRTEFANPAATNGTTANNKSRSEEGPKTLVFDDFVGGQVSNGKSSNGAGEAGGESGAANDGLVRIVDGNASSRPYGAASNSQAGLSPDSSRYGPQVGADHLGASSSRSSGVIAIRFPSLFGASPAASLVIVIVIALAVGGLIGALLHGGGSHQATQTSVPQTLPSPTITQPSTGGGSPVTGQVSTPTSGAPLAPVKSVTGSAAYNVAANTPIVVTANQPAWMELHKGGEKGPIVFSGTLPPGQSKPLTGPSFIRVGLPQAVTVTVSGQQATLPQSIPNKPITLYFIPGPAPGASTPASGGSGAASASGGSGTAPANSGASSTPPASS